MAGFEARRTVYKLDFEGTDLEGLEVRMRAGRLGDMLDPSNAEIGLNIDPDNPSAEDIKAVRAKFEMIAEYLASWNLVEDGVPVPATIEGLMDQALDSDAVAEIERTLATFRHPTIRFDHVATRRAGSRCFIDLHMHMPASWTLGRAAALRADVEQALMSAVPGLRATIQLLPTDVEAHFDDPKDLL